MGHGLALHWKTFAHVIETLYGQRYGDLDALISAARADLMFPVSSPEREPLELSDAPGTAQTQWESQSRRADSNR